MSIEVEAPDAVSGKRLELEGYLESLNQKIVNADTAGKRDISNVLRAIRNDVKKWIDAFDSAQTSFREALEEIVALHVFTEIYLDLSDKKA